MNPTQTQNISTRPSITLGPIGPTGMAWDAQPETFALAAHNLGKIVSEISREVITHGHKATKSDDTSNSKPSRGAYRKYAAH